MSRALSPDFGKFRDRVNSWPGWRMFEGRADKKSGDPVAALFGSIAEHMSHLDLPSDLFDAWGIALVKMRESSSQAQLAAALETSLQLMERTFASLGVAAANPSHQSGKAAGTADAGMHVAEGLLEQMVLHIGPVLAELRQCRFPLEYLKEIEGRISTLSVQNATEFMAALVILIRRIRDHAKREQNEMEHFLSQMSASLGAIEEIAQASKKNNADLLENRRQMDATLHKETSIIEGMALQAKDISILKRSIQSRVANIRAQVVKCQGIEQSIQAKAQQEMERLNTRLKEMEAETQQLKMQVDEEHLHALHDALTGVGNRRQFDEVLSHEYQRWRRYGNPLSLVVTDIDYFKRINDSAGHAAGDEVLRVTAHLLSSLLRASDLIARTGGEEFAIILPETTGAEAAEVAEKLRNAVMGSAVDYNGKMIKLTMSFGITEFREEDTRAAAYDRVDNALYKAKHGGRNRCVFQ